MKGTRTWVLQKIFACPNFYNAGRAPLNENNMMQTGTVQQRQSTRLGNNMDLRFGKALTLLKIVSNASLLPVSMLSTYANRIDCSICGLEKIR